MLDFNQVFIEEKGTYGQQQTGEYGGRTGGYWGERDVCWKEKTPDWTDTSYINSYFRVMLHGILGTDL